MQSSSSSTSVPPRVVAPCSSSAPPHTRHAGADPHPILSSSSHAPQQQQQLPSGTTDGDALASRLTAPPSGPASYGGSSTTCEDGGGGALSKSPGQQVATAAPTPPPPSQLQHHHYPAHTSGRPDSSTGSRSSRCSSPSTEDEDGRRHAPPLAGDRCAPALALGELCTAARAVAVSWMARLVDRPPTEEQIAHYRSLLQATPAKSGTAPPAPAPALPPPPATVAAPASTGGKKEPVRKPLSFLDAVTAGRHAAPPTATATAAPPAEDAAPLSARGRSSPPPLTALPPEPQPSPDYHTLELLPSQPHHTSELLCSLREVSLSCPPLGYEMGSSKRGRRRTRRSHPATPHAAPVSPEVQRELQQQWHAICGQFRTIVRLSLNKQEIMAALDRTLGPEWRTVGDDGAPSPPVAVGEAPAATSATRPDPMAGLEASGRQTSAKAEADAAPIYSPSQQVASFLERNSPTPSGHDEFSFPSAPLPPDQDAQSSSGTQMDAKSSPTFRLESREEMMRRRSAAPNAFYASASHHGGSHFLGSSAATTPASYVAGSGGVYTPLHNTACSMPVSPLMTSMTNSPITAPKCPYDYILVLDFEATCEEFNNYTYLYEIIEFPVVLVDVQLQREVAEFHRYVRPRHKPQLSPFCKALTGITQEDVDRAAPLEEVIKHFERWFNNTVPPTARCVFATDGPADFRDFMLTHSVERQGIRFPRMFYTFIDVKEAFAEFLHCSRGKIKTMLEVLHMPFTGRLHSGIDDARNIARIVIGLLRWGCTFCEVPLNRLPYSGGGGPAVSSPTSAIASGTAANATALHNNTNNNNAGHNGSNNNGSNNASLHASMNGTSYGGYSLAYPSAGYSGYGRSGYNNNSNNGNHTVNHHNLNNNNTMNNNNNNNNSMSQTDSLMLPPSTAFTAQHSNASNAYGGHGAYSYGMAYTNRMTVPIGDTDTDQNYN